MARILSGVVVSNKATKTIVVSVASSKTHPLYQKKYTIGKRFMVHDEKQQAEVGDKVTIIECRPLSARKRHSLEKIVEKAAISEKDLVKNVTAETAKAETEKMEDRRRKVEDPELSTPDSKLKAQSSPLKTTKKTEDRIEQTEDRGSKIEETSPVSSPQDSQPKAQDSKLTAQSPKPEATK